MGPPDKRIYPEIIVWEPYPSSQDRGKAVSAVVVETINILKDLESLEKWAFLSTLKIVFSLVIPQTKVQEVKDSLDKFKIRNVVLFSYQYHEDRKKYAFKKEN